MAHRARSRTVPPPSGRTGLTDGRRRAVVDRVRPEIDGGRFAIKRTVGESVRVKAWIHADGHDVIAAAMRYRTADAGTGGEWMERPMEPLGNDEWVSTFRIDRQCPHEYTVCAWIDHFATWRKEFGAKVNASQDVTSELLEGAALVTGTAERARSAHAEDEARWLDGEAARLSGSAAMLDRARVALDDRLARVAGQFPDRSLATEYGRVLTVSVDRERARYGAWYEMFPRSWGPDPTRSATFGEAEAHLARVAEAGFDVVYLPPIHPIGTTFRKGKGNTLLATPGDPGSPWAIGSPAGGHKAVDPGLGTIDDFDHFVAETRRLGMEVALDLAYQCSPDHPYVREHPEWFRHRPDGTIKYAENPPKKYQDIYPFNFDCEAWPALWEELRSVVEFWVAHGVQIFRVDNPHTKPYAFWEWMIREIRSAHPDVIFLAEAFTRPKVMAYLAKLGFTQSYTYFTWKNTKEDLEEYFTELTTTDLADVYRPNLFANTPDILHAYLQKGGPAAFKIRLTLAATLGATYGIYSGFEVCEGRGVPGSEEYLNSEKYQYRRWDWDQPGNIVDLVASLNRIRRANPALQTNDGLTFCETDNESLIAYCKVSADHANAILVVVNVDPARMQHGWVNVPLERLGLAKEAAFEVVDQLDGARYTWRGESNYVKLDPQARVAHVFECPVTAPDVVTEVNKSLPEFLPRQRWFAGKARSIERAEIADWAPTGAVAGDQVPAIAEVEYAGGTTERYFIPMTIVHAAAPVTVRAGNGTIARGADFAAIDAMGDDAACRTWLANMITERSVETLHGIIRATAYRRDAEPPALRISRSVAEQSNTSVTFDDRYVLKCLRRLEAGPHPEVEMSRYLASHGFPRVPPLVASLEYHRSGQEPTSLAMLQAFVPNQGTAWDPAVDQARAFLADEATETVEYAAAAALLGQRTAELHVVLAADRDDPAFKPVALTAADAVTLSAEIQRDAERALTRLADRLPWLPAAAHDRARAVLDARPALSARISSLATAPGGALRTRVHGDYHLGQILAVGQDFVIIDFEGEPTRSLAERREKRSPLKDVAGMLRSFSYAAATALFDAGAEHPDAIPQLERRAQMWEASVVEAFLTGYRKTTAGTALVPADATGFDQWLNAFLLEKAFYELDYELASRPDWVGIPLLGIARLVSSPDEYTGRR